MSSYSTPSPTVPLTTIYTPPSTCDPPRVEFYPVLGASSFHWSLLDNRDCYVPGGNANAASWHYTIWSPGVCPSGWTGNPTTHTDGGAYTSYCCPRELILDPERGASGVCLTSLAAWTENWGGIVTGVQPIPVQWASSDLDLFTPASAPILQRNQLSTAAATITQTITAVPSTATAIATTPDRPHRTPSQPHYEGPSASTNAGIIVGAILGFAVLCLAVWMLIHFLRKKRKSKSATGPSEVSATSMRRIEPETERDGIFFWKSRRAPPAYQAHEEQPIPEADSQAVAFPNSKSSANVQTQMQYGLLEADSVGRAELGGGWHGHEMRSPGR